MSFADFMPLPLGRPAPSPAGLSVGLAGLAADAIWTADADLRVATLRRLTPAGATLAGLMEGCRLTDLLRGGLPPAASETALARLGAGQPLADLLLKLRGAHGDLHLWLSGRLDCDGSGPACYEGLARLLPQPPMSLEQRREVDYLRARLDTGEANEARLLAENDVLLKCLGALIQPTPLTEKCQALIAHFADLMAFDAALILRCGIGGQRSVIAASQPALMGRGICDHPDLTAALAHEAILLSGESAYGYLLAALPPEFALYRSALAASVGINRERATLIAFQRGLNAFSDYDFRLMRRLCVVATDALQTEEHRIAALNAGKLASLGEMVSSIAHEINQPLSVIGLMSANIRHRLGASTPAIAEKLDTIDRQIERTGEIIAVVRNFVYPQRGGPVMAPVDVAQTLHSVGLLTRGLLSKRNIALHIDVAAEAAMVQAHALYLQQILVNLITNARDAIDQQRKAHAATGVNGEGRIAISAVAIEGGLVSLRVRDNGGGAPEPVIDRLFESFFTLKEQGKGTGLGLPICKSLAEEMGGSIAFCNVPGGAEIELRLKSA